ncbi:MAG: S8 family serine peptidase [Bacteroidota bacterium]
MKRSLIFLISLCLAASAWALYAVVEGAPDTLSKEGVGENDRREEVWEVQIAADSSDSLVLVNIFNATNGTNWNNSWDTTDSVSNWYGVKLDANGNVISLDLSSNNLKDSLPSLGKLKRLQRLNLQNNQLGYIENFGELPDIEVIDLSFNGGLRSLPTLDSLVNLKILRLGNPTQGMGLTSIPSLGNLKNLTALSLSNQNGLKGNIQGWTNLYALQRLEIDNTGITSFPPIPNPSQLRTLYIGFDNIPETELAIIASMPNMVSLKIVGFTKLSSLPAIDSLPNPNLVSLDISGNSNLQFLPNLSQFPNLQSLEIDYDSVLNNLDQVASVTSLEYFSASFCQLDSLFDLSKLVNLEILVLSVNNIRELEGLDQLTNLQELQCQVNQLYSLPNLNSLTQLRQVRFDGNNLASLHGLPKDNPYTEINVGSNRLTFGELEPYLSIWNNPSINATYMPQKRIGNILVYDIYQDSSILLTQPDTSSKSTYQWFKDGNLMAGEIEGAFLLTASDSTAEGDYFATIKHPDFNPLDSIVTQPRKVVFAGRLDPLLRELLRDGPTFVVKFPETIQDSEREKIKIELERIGLTLKTACHCGDMLLYEVPEILERVDENGVLNQIIGAEERIGQAETSAQPQEGGSDSTNVVWNYPINLGPTTGDRNIQWEAQVLDNTPAIRKVTIAVIDYGIDSSHSMINPFIWRNPLLRNESIDTFCYNDAINGYNFWDATNNAFQDVPPDALGHGTHIAGLVSSLLDSSIKNSVGIMSLQIGDAKGTTRLFEVACALKYAIDQDVDVINMSMGYDGIRSKIIDTLIKEAKDKNILIVTSSGNKGQNNDLEEDPFGHWPSNYSRQYFNVVAVGAFNPFLNGNNLDTCERGIMPCFSNYGANTVKILAPGVGINAPLPGEIYGTKNGTSIAVAFVTATIAQLIATHPDLDEPDEMVERVIGLLYSPPISAKDTSLIDFVEDGKILDIQLINCEDSPRARVDYFEVPAKSEIVKLDVLANDCYGQSTVLEFLTPDASPPNFTIKEDNEGFPFFKYEFTKNIGETDSISYLVKSGTTDYSIESYLIVKIVDELSVSGRATTERGRLIPNVDYIFESTELEINQTQRSDTFTFYASPSTQFQLSPSKTSVSKEGVDGADLVLGTRIIHSDLLELKDYQRIAADVNENQTFDKEDLAAIQAYILGKSDNFGYLGNRPSAWTFVPDIAGLQLDTFTTAFPSSRSYTDIRSSIRDQDFIGIKAGDIDLNWPSDLATMGSDIQIQLSETKTFVDDEISIPIRISSTAPISTFQFTLEWDTNVLLFEGLSSDSISLSTNENEVGNGRLSILWYNADTPLLTDDSPLFNLKFKVVGGARAQHTISLNDKITMVKAYDENLNPLGVSVDTAPIKVRGKLCAFLMNLCRSIRNQNSN